MDTNVLTIPLGFHSVSTKGDMSCVKTVNRRVWHSEFINIRFLLCPQSELKHGWLLTKNKVVKV